MKDPVLQMQNDTKTDCLCKLPAWSENTGF